MQTIENSDFVVEFRANGEVVVQSKKSCARATFCSLPSGIVVIGGSSNLPGEIVTAFGEGMLFIHDKLKFYF